MIDYELAKKLKNTGFPQRVAAKHPGYTGFGYGYVDDLGLYYPTLSELIEECGTRVQLDWFPDTSTAYVNCCERKEHERTGSTAEEAVANLWLALNAT